MEMCVGQYESSKERIHRGGDIELYLLYVITYTRFHQSGKRAWHGQRHGGKRQLAVLRSNQECLHLLLHKGQGRSHV